MFLKILRIENRNDRKCHRKMTTKGLKSKKRKNVSFLEKKLYVLLFFKH